MERPPKEIFGSHPGMPANSHFMHAMPPGATNDPMTMQMASGPCVCACVCVCVCVCVCLRVCVLALGCLV